MAGKSRDNKGNERRRTPRKSWGAFSPLIRRILAVNVFALGILGGGILYLDQFRTNLIDTLVADLEADAEIIAGAIGESATTGPETKGIEIEPARQIIRRLIGRGSRRARLFSTDGDLVADSRFMNLGRSVYVIPLPPPDEKADISQRIADWFNSSLDAMSFSRSDLPPYKERARQLASDYPEAVSALAGEPQTAIRKLVDGTPIISVAVPVQRFRRVLGVLILTTDASDIQQIVRQERMTILQVFGLSLVVTLLLSFFLAGTIARPIHKLAAAADEVRRGIGRSPAMQAFTHRRDEIGALSRSLSAMTETLYHQLDAVESFAADIAHELKNPLSSMRSAVETVQRTDDEAVKEKLLQIIQEDVQRLDRLISDISDASRLESELSRAEMEPVDLGMMALTLVEAYNATGSEGAPTITLQGVGPGKFVVPGLEGRLSQVVRNLLDNALSFSPSGGLITVRLGQNKMMVELTIEDEGPGLPEGSEDKIFERFYSERPTAEAFGKHSGLGLSISRQIVEAHGGTIRAENRKASPAPDTETAANHGAKFILLLPR